jgi:DNA polymerase-3 subunit alpha
MFLNAYSWFSFHYGIMSVRELLQQAAAAGIRKLALTDINNTAGVADFVRLAPDYGIEPVAGIDFRNGNRRLFVALAHNNEGFAELNRYLSAHLHQQHKAFHEEAPEWSNVSVIYDQQNVPKRSLREGEFIGVRPAELTRLISSPYKHLSHKMLLLQSLLFRDKTDFNVHRLLRAIDENTLLSRLSSEAMASVDGIVMPAEQRQMLQERFPELCAGARNLLHRCHIAFDFHEPKNKRTFTGSARLDRDLLERECDKGMVYRYGQNIDEAVRARTRKELDMISKLGFQAYFLINWDIIRFARSKGFFHVGRGSGANSMVAYLLGITDVDPIELDLYFERFINEFRTSPPDFDLDFSWKERDQVIDYIFRRHGRDHVAQIATYTTFQGSSVIRELGKVFGLPKSEIDELVFNRRHPETPDHIARMIFQYGKRLLDMPSHFGIHAGGILISELPLCHYTATHIPPKGFPVTQFSMLEAEDLGLYKYDILSQRGLGHIRDTVEIVKQNRGVEVDIHQIKKFKQDERVRTLLREGKCMGCFYIESPAMRMLLTKLRCDDYITLVAASSIIRPGVSRSGMMRAYIERFHDPSKVQYVHESMRPLLEETYGVMVYQEDVIKVAHHFAGLSLSESDVLRRGMSGKFRSKEEFDKIRDRFFSSCRERGYAQEVASEVWRQIESFAGYSFSKGHSASYAVESYQSLYLKAHYPLEFMVGVINNFGGFYRTEYYIHEARMLGAKIEAPCINHSQYLSSIDAEVIWLGFVHLSGLEQKPVMAMLEERRHRGPYASLFDFMQRVSIEIEQLRLLIRIGAFRFTGKTKQELLWDLHLRSGGQKRTMPRQELFSEQASGYTLPTLEYELHGDALDEIELLGFPLCSPFDLLKQKPDDIGVKARDLKKFQGKQIKILGYYVTMKPTRTVKGEEMAFGTFIDQEGTFFDTVHFPPALKAHPFRGKSVYEIRGKVTEEFGVWSIEAETLMRLELQSRPHR